MKIQYKYNKKINQISHKISNKTVMKILNKH